jgi:hypothetical protein
MDNVIEVVALLRKHSELELQILNGHGVAVATERELEATQRRLAAHTPALNAVLQTARALRRTPDAVSVTEVAKWGCSKWPEESKATPSRERACVFTPFRLARTAARRLSSLTTARGIMWD